MDKVEVTQQDRDAAELIFLCFRAGRPSKAIEEIARHRIAARKQALEEAAWRPIETAPKDGTRILAQWLYHKTQSWFETEWCPAEHGDKAGWWAREWGWLLDGYEPVRWMPLPAPPSTAIRALSEKDGQER